MTEQVYTTQMTDKEYAQMMQDAVAAEKLEDALHMLTLLHREREARTFAFWNGERSRQSVRGKKYVDTVNAVREKFGVHVTYSRNNKFEIKIYPMDEK